MNLLEMNPHETRFIPLIGSPIGGSTASFLYNKVFSAYDINAMSYPVEVKKGDLPEFLKAVKYAKAAGFILTMPHKQDIIAYLDEIDETSRVFNSVNAVRIRPDGSLEGHGMDGKGVVGAFEDSGVSLAGKRVLMLGAGGVSGVFAAELAAKGISSLTVLNRTVEKAKFVADTLSSRTDVKTDYGVYTPENACAAAGSADILIQATCLGMKNSGCDHEDLGFLSRLPAGAWVMEAVSNPPETSLIREAKRLGLGTILGMDMLVCQMEALCRFLLDTEVPAEAKTIGRDFYCKLFNYQR